jgi:hypothetical protein
MTVAHVMARPGVEAGGVEGVALVGKDGVILVSGLISLV